MIYAPRIGTGNFGAQVAIPILGANSVGMTISRDGTEVFLASAPTVNDREIMRTTRYDATTFDPPIAQAELNSAGYDAFPTLSPDGLEIYFEYNDLVAGSLIVMATRPAVGMPFSTPVPVPAFDTIEFEGDPWISAAGTEMYFARWFSVQSDVVVATRVCN